MRVAETLADDLLKGAAEIATFIGETERRVRYLAEHKLIPVRWVGNRMYSTKSALRAHYAPVQAA